AHLPDRERRRGDHGRPGHDGRRHGDAADGAGEGAIDGREVLGGVVERREVRERAELVVEVSVRDRGDEVDRARGGRAHRANSTTVSAAMYSRTSLSRYPAKRPAELVT